MSNLRAIREANQIMSHAVYSHPGQQTLPDNLMELMEMAIEADEKRHAEVSKAMREYKTAKAILEQAIARKSSVARSIYWPTLLRKIGVLYDLGLIDTRRNVRVIEHVEYSLKQAMEAAGL